MIDDAKILKVINRFNIISIINSSKSKLITFSDIKKKAAKAYYAPVKPPEDNYRLSFRDAEKDIYGLTNDLLETYLINAKKEEEVSCHNCNGMGYFLKIHGAGSGKSGKLGTPAHEECYRCLGKPYDKNFIYNITKDIAQRICERLCVGDVYCFESGEWHCVQYVRQDDVAQLPKSTRKLKSHVGENSE